MGKKIVESFKNLQERRKRKAKFKISRVENILAREKRNERFENLLDEVAQIIYSQICQLTKIDSLGLNNLTRGV